MQFDGALIREQGVTFAIAIVRKAVLADRVRASSVAQSFQSAFPGVPIVLMAQDSHGTPTYLGRRDLVQFLAATPLRSIPWRRYTSS
jgi:hypothetical protein